MSIAAYRVNGTGANHVIVVIGLGLIGEEVSTQLATYCQHIKFTEPNNIQWVSSKPLLQQLTRLIDSEKPSKLEIVWCAGRAGFNASRAQMDAETEFYSTFFNHLQRYLTSAHKRCYLTANLLSTAGGIYEHSGFVDSLDCTSAQREYALGKLKQEKLLEDLSIPHRIYRISSVYGANKLGGRVSLIAALLTGARRRTPVTIYARADTLRDYIFYTDVANYIVKQVLDETNSHITLLASGRPTSISALVSLVNNITGRRLNTSYHHGQQNQRDITFSKKLIDPALSITSIEEGLRLVNRKLFVSNA